MDVTKAPDPPPPYQSTPAAETTDQAMVIANLKAQNAGQAIAIDNLKAQNARLLAILEHTVLNGAAPPAAVEDVAPNSTARADIAYQATSFGQECLSHIMHDDLIAILDESLCSAPGSKGANLKNPADPGARADLLHVVRAALPIFVASMAKMIYVVPVNQPWYTLGGGILISQTDDGWELKTARGEVVQIGQMIYCIMSVRLSSKDRPNDAYDMIMSNMRNGRKAGCGCINHTTSLVYV